MRLICLIVLLLLAVTGAVVSAASEKLELKSKQTIEQEAPKSKLPALFDFQKYKQIFHKHYGSLMEEMRRRSLFIPRVLRIIGCKLKYIYGKQKYHCAVNHMTDYFPEEIDKMRNHLGKPKQTLQSSGAEQRAETVESVNATDKELSQDLAELAKEVPEVGKLLNEEENSLKGRVMRSHLEVENSVPENWVKFDSSTVNNKDSLLRFAELSDEARFKFDSLSVNNVVNVPKKTLSEQLVPVESKSLIRRSQHVELFDLFKQNLRAQIGFQSGGEYFAQPETLHSDDHLFIDHSRDGCMDLVRDQGKCGACYAFASVAIYEWLYCKKYDKLERFSEQYMIDCGKEHMDTNINGCDGASTHAAVEFVKNFGLEKRTFYPYRGLEQECPYNDGKTSDISTTGFVRFDTTPYLEIPYELYEEFLFYGPLMVSVMADGSDFYDYAGGIHELNNCDPKSKFGHVMVLVGHGRQDGTDYWKFRNSYSVGWGEQGYYRVSKENKVCFHETGAALATRNGRDHLSHEMKHNPLHDRRVLKKMYWQAEAEKRRQEEEETKRAQERAIAEKEEQEARATRLNSEQESLPEEMGHSGSFKLGYFMNWL